MKQEQKEAQIEVRDLLGIGMSLVVLIIGLAYGLDVTGDVKQDFGEEGCADITDYTYFNETAGLCQNVSADASYQSPGTSEFNATVDGMDAVSKITDKLPTVALVIMAAVIIGILIRYLWGAYSNNM